MRGPRRRKDSAPASAPEAPAPAATTAPSDAPSPSPALRAATIRVLRIAAQLLVRWSGLGMAIVLALGGHEVEAAVAMLVALAQVIAWRSAYPWRWEVALSATAMAAALSSYLDLYARIPWWDVPVHAVLTGLLAMLGAVLIGRPRFLPVLAIGAGLAVLWEGLELWGHLVVDPAVDVRPADTALDLMSGLLGTAVAARLWQRRRPPVRPPFRGCSPPPDAGPREGPADAFRGPRSG